MFQNIASNLGVETCDWIKLCDNRDLEKEVLKAIQKQAVTGSSKYNLRMGCIDASLTILALLTIYRQGGCWHLINLPHLLFTVNKGLFQN